MAWAACCMPRAIAIKASLSKVSLMGKGYLLGNRAIATQANGEPVKNMAMACLLGVVVIAGKMFTKMTNKALMAS